MADSEKKGMGKWWPFLGSAIIILGLFKSSVYYHSFNITITDYLDLGEALLLFSGDIVAITIPLLLSIIFSFTLHTDVDQSRVGKFREEHTKAENFWKRLPLYLKFYFFPFFVMVLSGLLYIATIVIKSNTEDYLPITLFGGSAALFCILVIMDEVKLACAKYQFFSFTYRDQGLIYMFILLLFLSFMQARHDAYNKKYVVDPIVHTFRFKEANSIQTSKDTIYLGKTKGYIFLYVRSSRQSIVFKNEDVKSFTTQVNVK